jgi:hypothetical protein
MNPNELAAQEKLAGDIGWAQPDAAMAQFQNSIALSAL